MDQGRSKQSAPVVSLSRGSGTHSLDQSRRCLHQQHDGEAILRSWLSKHCRLEPKSLLADDRRENYVDENQHPLSRWQNPATRHNSRRLHQSPPVIRPRGRAESQEIPSAGSEPDDGKDSDRRAASRRGNRHQFPFTVSSKSQTGADVFVCQVGEVFDNVLCAHTGGKVLQYIVHGHAEAADAGLAPTLLRIDSNAVLPIHMVQGSLGTRKDQGCNRKSASVSFLPP